MGTVDLPKKNKTVRAQAHNAYIPQTGENRQDSLDRILQEQTGRLSARIAARLPAENIPRLDEKVYDFISQNYRILCGNFPLPDTGKTAPIAKTAAAVTAVLESSGGSDQFNTGVIEKSLKNRQWGIDDLDARINNMLRQKDGISSVVDSRKANSIAVCVFRDNAKKPKTVTDLRLAVNIPETQLIDPESRFRAGAAYLIREIICKHLSESIERKINTEESGGFLDSLLNERLDAHIGGMDEHLQNIGRSAEMEAIRDRGFSAASNLLVSILNTAGLDCQFLENLKEKRELLIREYEDTNEDILPDERYQIRLCYFSEERLLEEREAYDGRLAILSGEAQRLWDLLEVIYQDSKSVFKVNDFEDLARKNKSRINELIRNGAGGFPYDPRRPGDTGAAQGEKEKIRILLAKMEERIKNISDSMYPVERHISQERLSLLEREFSRFEHDINPYNVQPGILADIDLTSIKRKRTTLDSMSAALGRFLDNVSNCFCDGPK
ncbi:MAG: hypothetical protein LBU85_08595 [Treponema sp.]|jgi:hypothetical protein|nr:hypothetical protein [Treponema sp.]